MATEHIVEGLGLLVYPEAGVFTGELHLMFPGDGYDPRAPRLVSVQVKDLYDSELMVNPLNSKQCGHQGWSVSATRVPGRYQLVETATMYVEQTIERHQPGWLADNPQWLAAWTNLVSNPTNPNVFAGQFVYRYFT